MTNENSIKILTNYHNSVVRLKSLEDEVSFWNSRLKNTNKLNLPTKSTLNIKDIINNLIKNIESELNQCLEFRTNCINILDEIENSSVKQVLYLRYINGLGFEEISKRIKYCKRHTERLYKKGLDILQGEDVKEHGR